MTTITERLTQVNHAIQQACVEAGRSPETVNLLAVSKTQPTEAVAEALTAGQVHFGENYLQDALTKIPDHPGAQWHFIGAIQSKKTREITDSFDWVHSIASQKIARRLSDQRDPERGPLKALIQVNLSGEEAKSGISIEAADQLVQALLPMTGISLQGFMAIPEATNDESLLRQRFTTLRELRDRVSANHGIKLPHLSMGMTSDFRIAIQEGATWIRIGTAIFGPRKPR